MLNEKVAEAYVELAMPMASFNQSVASIPPSLNRLEGHAATTGKTMGHRMSESFKHAVGNLAKISLVGGAAGVAAVGYGLARAVTNASDLNETLNKAGAIFGDNVKIVIASADKMAEKFGTPKQEFIDAAARLAGLAQGAGIAGDKAAIMGSKFAEAAMDASSFYNMDFSEIIDRLQSGLSGEAEPMRKLNIFLTEAGVEAEALSQGFKKVDGHLSTVASTSARAAIIFKGLSVAEGDLGKTAGEWANRLREVKGRLVGVSVAIGQYLLPAAKQLGLELSDITKSMQAGFTGGIDTAFKKFAEWANHAAQKVGILYRNFSDVIELTKSIGMDFVSAIPEGLKSLAVYFYDLAKNFVTSFVSAMPEVLKSLAAYFNDLAKNFLTSLADAIVTSSMKLAVHFYDMAKNFGEILAESVKKAFQIPTWMLKPAAYTAPAPANVKAAKATPAPANVKAAKATPAPAFVWPKIAKATPVPAFVWPKIESNKTIGIRGRIAETEANKGLERSMEGWNAPAKGMSDMEKTFLAARNKKAFDLMGTERFTLGSRHDRRRAAMLAQNRERSDDIVANVIPKQFRRGISQNGQIILNNHREMLRNLPQELPKTKADFVGLEEMAKKIQLAALDKDNYPKQTAELLSELVKKTGDVEKAVKMQKVGLAVGPA